MFQRNCGRHQNVNVRTIAWHMLFGHFVATCVAEAFLVLALDATEDGVQPLFQGSSWNQLEQDLQYRACHVLVKAQVSTM
jgi:hypothetical protein